MRSQNSSRTDTKADAVSKALRAFLFETREFIRDSVKEHDPDVLERVPEERRVGVKEIDDIAATGDPTALLAILFEAWDKAFEHQVKEPGVSRGLVDKVRHIRNDSVHNYERDFTDDDLRAINDLRKGLVGASPKPKPPPNQHNTQEPYARPRPAPRPTHVPRSAPAPVPTAASDPPRRKILRLVYFSALMAVVCVLGPPRRSLIHFHRIFK